MGQRELHAKEVGHALQAAHAAVDVVAQEDEVARRQRHAEPPDVVGEEVQVLQVAVDVAEDVGRTLEEGDARLGLEDWADAGVELEQVLGELGAVEVGHVGGRVLEHLRDAVDDVGYGGGGFALPSILAGGQRSSAGDVMVVVGQGVEDGRRGDAGAPSHPGAEVGHLLPLGAAALDGVLVDVVAVRAEGVVAPAGAGPPRPPDGGAAVILPRERRQLVLEERHLLLEGGDLGITLDEEGGRPILAAASNAADATDAAAGHAPRALGGVGPAMDDDEFDLICNCNTGTTDK